MATIKDIAALAGVSHGTVSNVLNGRGNVSVEKITLVENAARQLGYTINAQARQLRKGTSKRVGVIVPRIGIKRYQDLYLGIEQELKGRGYEVDLHYTNDLTHCEEKILEDVEATNPIAVVLVSAFGGEVRGLRGDGRLILAERSVEKMPEDAVYCGFDYGLAGDGEALPGGWAQERGGIYGEHEIFQLRPVCEGNSGGVRRGGRKRPRFFLRRVPAIPHGL